MAYSSELEWRLCAAWANYRFDDWLELDVDQMVAHLAAYRTHNQIEGVLAMDRARKMNSRSGKK